MAAITAREIDRKAPGEPAPAEGLDEAGRYLVMLRWVLIIAIAYVVLFSRPLDELAPPAALFIALYLGSNLVVAHLLQSRLRRNAVEWGVVVTDIAAVTLAISMTGEERGELFVLYFVVLFLSALADGVLLAAGAAVFIGAAHLYTAAEFIDAGTLVSEGYAVRIPFLFAVALFFGHLVQRARSQERERQAAAMRARRMELLSTVSHDLRNPLGVVDALAGLLIDGDAGPLNGDQQTLLQRMRVSIRQVLHLANNLIDAERIELDNLPVHREFCDLRNTIDETLVVADVAAGLKGVALVAELPAEQIYASVDCVQIERAIANVLGNAIKFTPAGGVVRVSIDRRDGWLSFSVEDGGPGFAAEQLREIGRKHSTGPQRKGGGTGLGLYIAAAAVRAHGGRLGAVNRVGGGARVTLDLPAPLGSESLREVVVAPVPEQATLAAAG